MGLGLFKNGRYQPITPYKGSWAESMAKSRDASLESDCQKVCSGAAFAALDRFAKKASTRKRNCRR